MSNAERQRRFRERNPGYDGRLHARLRAAARAAVQTVAAKREPLLLPAPVELLEIPGLNAIPTTPDRERVHVIDFRRSAAG